MYMKKFTGAYNFKINGKLGTKTKSFVKLSLLKKKKHFLLQFRQKNASS